MGKTWGGYSKNSRPYIHPILGPLIALIDARRETESSGGCLIKRGIGIWKGHAVTLTSPVPACYFPLRN